MSDTHTPTRLEAARAELTEAQLARDRALAAVRAAHEELAQVDEELLAARQQATLEVLGAAVERKERATLALRELTATAQYQALRLEQARREHAAIEASIAVQREAVRRLQLEPDFARRRLAELEGERLRLEAGLVVDDARVAEAAAVLVALGGEAG